MIKFIKKLFKRFTTVSMGVLSLVAILGLLATSAPAFAAGEVTTNTATGITTSDATLNGTVGPADAGQESFWVSLAPIDTSSSSIPAGVYSTPVLAPVAANGTFSDPLSLVTTSGIPGNMPAITPNTTYYFVAWANVGGTWYPGDVLSFTTTDLPGTLSAEDFGVAIFSGVKGYTAGFGVADNTFAGATSVVVKLYAAGDVLLQTNTAILPKFNLDITGTQFSSPFDISGTFNYALDGYWTNVREAQYGQSVPAVKVVATVTLANGKVVTAENDNPTGDPTTIYPVTTPSVVTNPATLVTTTSATVNGTNGPVNADNTSFWWGTGPAGSLTPMADPTSEFPSGWTHDSGLGSVSAGVSFSEALTGLTPNTTYNFVAWSQVGGIWYPGSVLIFKTSGEEVCTPDDATQTIVSDSSTQYNGGDSTVLVPNGAWVSIPGASWIWGTDGSTDNTTVPTTEAFMRNFSITGTPTSASIDLSTDNGYVLKVNGTTVDSQNVDPANEFNYKSVHTYDILAYVHSGTNTLEVDVTNFGRANTTFNMNPAGLLYKLTLTSDECVTPPPTTTSTISGMKYNDLNRNGKKDTGEPGLQGWVIRLLLDDPVTNKDTLVATTTTDVNGNYSFTDVAPGIYDVRETHQNGWKRISKNPKDIVITDTSVITGVDFGNAVKKKFEKDDTTKDDNRDDQSGHYFGNHGRSNYIFDQFNKSHMNFNGHFGFKGNSGFKGNLLNFFKR